MTDPKNQVWRPRYNTVRNLAKKLKWFLGLALLILQILKALLDLWK